MGKVYGFMNSVSGALVTSEQSDYSFGYQEDGNLYVIPLSICRGRAVIKLSKKLYNPGSKQKVLSRVPI